MMSVRSDALLPFGGFGECLVQYSLDYNGREYYVRYRYGWVSVQVDDLDAYEKRIGDEYDGVWTDEETTVYLAEISGAIREDGLGRLDLPTLWEARSHAMFRKGPLPQRAVGLGCGLSTDPSAPRMITHNRHERRRRQQAGIHDHTVGCTVYVPACEVRQWVAEHPAEHEAFRKEYPRQWESYLQTQASTVNEASERQWPHRAT